MRTIIELTDAQIDALSDWCRREQISRAEAVRRAIDGMLKQFKHSDRDAAFGLWRHKRINARRFVDRLRTEWDR